MRKAKRGVWAWMPALTWFLALLTTVVVPVMTPAPASTLSARQLQPPAERVQLRKASSLPEKPNDSKVSKP